MSTATTSRRVLASALPMAGVIAWTAARPQLSGLDPVDMLMTIVLLALCLSIHEAAHGWVALRCGDTTARDLGRITLNPLVHVDLFMTILIPAMLYWGTGGHMLFGGAKPVPVSFHRLRHPWRDMSLVALAGPASNLLLAVFFLVALKFFVATGFYNGAAAVLDDRYRDFLPQVLLKALSFNVLLAVFNMVPIPPLDGSRVMAWMLPEGIRENYASLERFGMYLVFGLIWFVPSFNYFLGETVDAVIRFLDALIPIRVPG